jgi:hypothetical protein
MLLVGNGVRSCRIKLGSKRIDEEERDSPPEQRRELGKSGGKGVQRMRG